MLLQTLDLFPVYEVPEQIRRRIDINGNTGTLTELGDIVSRQGQDATNTLEYRNALANIVGFDATPDGFERPLVNVSDSDRNVTQFAYEARDTGVFNFVMVLVANPVNETRSQEIRYIVTGYTSQAEQSLLGTLPDDMVLYINEIFGMQTTYTRNAHGEKKVNPNGFIMVDNYVLSRALAAGEYQEASINAINVTKSADMVKKLGLGENESIELTDDTLFAPVSSTTPTLLAGHLTQPTNFVTSISNSYLKTMGRDDSLNMIDSFFEGTGGSSVEQELQSMGVVRQFTNYDLIKAFRQALTNATGNSQEGWGMSQRANFRLRDLRAALVNPDKLATMLADSLAVNRRRGFGQVEQTDQWIGRRNYSTMGSLVAYDLAMQLGAILSRALVGRVSFMFDNRNADFTQPPLLNVYEDSIHSLSDAQLTRALAERFRNDLHALFVKVTKHNHIRCAIHVVAILGSVTRVEVLMEGDVQREYYTFAGFMSSRLHSGNTTSLAYAGKLAKQTSKLMESIEDGFNSFERGANTERLFSNIPTRTGGLTGNSLLDTADTPIDLNTIGGLGKRNSLLD